MTEWKYEPFDCLQRPISESLTVFPREKDISFSAIRFFWNGVMRLWLKLYFRLKISGKQHLPKMGNFVLISNHSSHLDAICLLASLPFRSISTTFALAAKDYFFSTFFRSFFAAIAFNALPFEREKNPRRSLELCADVLSASQSALVMFPEGTRSLDGQMQPFKSGLGFLVAGTDRLVVPAHISGAHQAWAKGSFFPKPKKIRVQIGPPLVFKDVPRTKEGYAHIAKTTQQAVELCSLSNFSFTP